MALDAIKHSIIADAQAKAAAIDKDGSAKAKAILDQARIRADKILEEAGKQAEAEAERINSESKAGAEIEANVIILEAKGLVIEQALSELLALAKKELIKSGMKTILADAIKQFRRLTDDELIVFAGPAAYAVGKISGATLKRGDVEGFILSNASGTITIEASIDAIIRSETDSARSILLPELFGYSGKVKATSENKTKNIRKVGTSSARSAKRRQKGR